VPKKAINDAKFKIISSRNNDLIKYISLLQNSGPRGNKLRADDKCAVLEGVHLLQAWLHSKKNYQLETIITTKQALENEEIRDLFYYIDEANLPLVNWILIDADLIQGLASTKSNHFVIGLIKLGSIPTAIDFTQDLVILDRLQDPGNVGNILRSCVASGFNQIISIKGTVSLWAPKVIRAGMGAHVHLNICEGSDLVDISKDFITPLLGTSLSVEAANIFEMTSLLKDPVMWVFGNEGAGISKEFSNISKGVFIPQSSKVESLNVSAAAAICLFECVRIRSNQF